MIPFVQIVFQHREFYYVGGSPAVHGVQLASVFFVSPYFPFGTYLWFLFCAGFQPLRCPHGTHLPQVASPMLPNIS